MSAQPTVRAVSSSTRTSAAPRRTGSVAAPSSTPTTTTSTLSSTASAGRVRRGRTLDPEGLAEIGMEPRPRDQRKQGRIATMNRSDREGKVFLDWSQNNGAKTTVSPYSLRGRSIPTVAAPRTWEELEDPDLSQLGYGEVLDRLSRLGDPLEAMGPPFRTETMGSHEARHPSGIGSARTSACAMPRRRRSRCPTAHLRTWPG